MIRRPAGALALLFVAAVAARLLFCWWLHPTFLAPHTTVGEIVFFDSYREIAANTLAGRGYVLDSGVPAIHRPPGYTLILMASAPGRPELAKVLFQSWNALLGGFAALLTFLLARRGGLAPPASFGAGAVAALWPFLVWESKVTVPENLLAALIPALALVLLRMRENPSAAGALALGTLAGFTALTHATHQVLGFLVPLLLLIPPRRTRARMLALVFLAFLATILPWVARNEAAAGYPGLAAGFGLHYFKGTYAFDRLLAGGAYFRDHDVPATAAISTMLAERGLGPIDTDEARSDPRRNAVLDHAALRHLLAHPLYTIAKSGAKLPLAWVHQQTPARSAATALLLAPLFVLALGNGRDLFSGPLGAIAGLVFGINLAAAAVFSEAIPMRYALPLVPLLAVLSAAGAERLRSRWGRSAPAGESLRPNRPPDRSRT